MKGERIDICLEYTFVSQIRYSRVCVIARMLWLSHILDQMQYVPEGAKHCCPINVPNRFLASWVSCLWKIGPTRAVSRFPSKSAKHGLSSIENRIVISPSLSLHTWLRKGVHCPSSPAGRGFTWRTATRSNRSLESGIIEMV